MIGRVRVFGPAYLDRVLRVDGPLLDGSPTSPLDRSVDGRIGFGPADEGRLTLVDPADARLAIELPADWPGPRGIVELQGPLGAPSGARIERRGQAWTDDLGGMGAGFAAALGGELTCALGPPEDPTSRAVVRLLAGHGIDVRPIRTDGPADWTLLLSSGAHGDKLAIGFRGCHAALAIEDVRPSLDEPCEVRIVAGLPNRIAAEIFRAPGACLRVFAPAMRNMTDRETLVRQVVAPVDLLCCNREEWEALDDREEVAARLSILVVTEGAAGAWARFTDPVGDGRMVRVGAFPRSRPPRDVNRAGEAFASRFVSEMLEGGWRPASCVAEVELVRAAMLRASTAAALVLDREDFGFPSAHQVEAAAARGVVD